LITPALPKLKRRWKRSGKVERKCEKSIKPMQGVFKTGNGDGQGTVIWTKEIEKKLPIEHSVG